MITKDRYYLPFEMRTAQGGAEGENIVEGYAAVFERPTVLYTENGVEYCEIISRTAFAGVDLSDVVMNYNHTGKPVARTRNGSLVLTIDDTGLKVTARLGGTQEARAMYEEIKGGYIDKMSFCFVADRSADTYENIPGRYTRRINRIKTVYDVAAVDFPAYDDTLLREFKQEFGERCMIPVRQGSLTLSAPMKELKADLAAGRIVHNNNPVLQMCLTNTEVLADTNGNIKPIKGIDLTQRIDGTIALICAYIALINHYDDLQAVI